MKQTLRFLAIPLLVLSLVAASALPVPAASNENECRAERNACLQASDTTVGEVLCWVEYNVCQTAVALGKLAAALGF